MSQNNQPPQNSNPQPTPSRYREYDDEISLIDLWQVLMHRKYVIIGTLVAVMLAAIVYLVATPRVYEANTRLLLPRQSNLSLVGYEHPLTSFESKQIFDEFSEFILQVSTWRRFVEENSDHFPPESDLERIAREHPIETNKDKDVDFEHLILTYEANDPERVAAILSNYLRFAEKRYIDTLLHEVNSRLQQRKETLENEINTLRETTRMNREDEIERLRTEINKLKAEAELIHKDNIEKLREDLALAKSLGIIENRLLRDGGARTGGDLTVIPANAARNYMRGTKELKEELDALLKRDALEPYIQDFRAKQTRLNELTERESDDPYIGSLREKQVTLTELNSLNLKTEKFHPYRSDGRILPPLYPAKPNIKLVLALAIVLGLMLGIFAAFFAEFIRKAHQATTDATR